ncbi:glycoside hydrolase family 2 TIM barrel-domain containing protein [Bacteroides sp.]|uniref:glycoside hydrolase family 2 TIM barrel-domain containing protein n=1 Tax=Bacteroides sp. TaxID=29523 RepID=UPI002FC615E6
MNKRHLLLSICCLLGMLLHAQPSAVSTAGFYELEKSGREVYNMNQGWQYCKGKQAEASKESYNDAAWTRVSLPHGLELLPEEASGNINYQGEAWYRKTFVTPVALNGKTTFLHFEGIMGKSKIFLNGTLLKEHFDGYLPVTVEVTNALRPAGEKNVLAVCADNSDDPTFPPGKPQQALDFTYFGGIYRDCFLIAHQPVYITDAMYEEEVAGGGVFIHFPEVSESRAKVGVKVHVRNATKKGFTGKLLLTLKNSDGTVVAQEHQTIKLRAQKANHIETELTVLHPELWYPDAPALHHLELRIADASGTVIDGMVQQIGIKKIEYRKGEGLYMNGKPYTDKLIGVNRHQEFAIIGNAVPNSLHWRDAKKLRDAGVRVVRCTQYPHDPAFLDACDRMGMLVLLPIAGWQFWNNEPIFAQRVYTHIRRLVRRDRNHPSLFIWEPVLNETHFPQDYAHRAKQCVDEEFPYEKALSAIDPGSKGSEVFPVIFTHPQAVSGGKSSIYNAGNIDPAKMYFTREFGDNVDDWNSHNSNSRVHRSWGEVPMLEQAVHYASPSYTYTCLETLYEAGKHHVGGTLWHAFDHQRGYHPQPFYGGIMDAFRQPKTSYYLFMAQRPPVKNDALPAATGPMVYVANEMTPFSPADITVYSNCPEVRLTVFADGKRYEYHRSQSSLKMPSPIITFKDAYHFMELKALARAGKQKDIFLLAEGLIDGKVVATHKRIPSKRPTTLRLRIDDDGCPLKADGSDIVTVIAEVVDKDGAVKRLNHTSVKFTVTGEGRLLGDETIEANPVDAHWGSAPILLQATGKPGKITIRAEVFGHGVHSIAADELVYTSVPASGKYLTLQGEEEQSSVTPTVATGTTQANSSEVKSLKEEVDQLRKRLSEYELREVERQQDDFGEQR